MTKLSHTPLLRVQDLCVDYLGSTGWQRAVDRVSFDLSGGEVFGLAGESGSGKSTVAFAVCRLHRPPTLISGGSVTLNGVDVLGLEGEDLRRWRWREASVVLQSAMNALNPMLTIGTQFDDMLKAHGVGNRRERQERAAHLLGLVRIAPDRLRAYPHQFSGGMRQRIVIALALALNPRLIVMDEPTTALDVVTQREILEEITDLRQQFNFAVLFITHDLALMSQFCDRMGIMRRGQLLEVGPPDRLMTAPEHPYTRQLWDSLPPLHPRETAGGRPFPRKENQS